MTPFVKQTNKIIKLKALASADRLLYLNLYKYPGSVLSYSRICFKFKDFLKCFKSTESYKTNIQTYIEYHILCSVNSQKSSNHSVNIKFLKIAELENVILEIRLL